jgi:hypothetical protein
VSDHANLDAFPPIRLSSSAFSALREYSRTLPTGTTIGKRWKRNARDGYYFPVDVWGLRFVFPAPPRWMMGEYAESTLPGMVDILWYRVEVVDGEGERCASAL